MYYDTCLLRVNAVTFFRDNAKQKTDLALEEPAPFWFQIEICPFLPLQNSFYDG